MTNKNKKPKPAYTFKGRPVYKHEDLETLKSRLPNESAWVRELKKRQYHTGEKFMLNDNGLLCHEEGKCLGHLMTFTGHGVYEPNLGKVDVDPALVDTHNNILDQMYIDGLQNCQVGQGGFFYLSSDKATVKTFTGKLVSDQVSIHGKSITFTHGGMKFRGRLSNDSDAFNFRRVD